MSEGRQIIFSMVNVSRTLPEGKKILKDIYLSFYYGAKIGILGLNGSGKSTLMKILFGLIEPDDSSSEIFINDKKMKFFSPLDAIAADIGMVQQHFALAGPLSALDNIILGDEPTNGGFIDRAQAQLILEALAGEQLSVPWHKPAEDLSVGLQQRLEILKLLFRKASILILDEPTNHLDIKSKEVIEESLRNFKGTILLISHDRYFVNQLNVNRAITIENKQIVEENLE